MAFKEEVRISHKVMGSAKISHSCGSLRQRACFLKIGHKNEFAQGSHSCAFSHRDFWRDREMLFENWPQKRIRTRGCVVRISHKRIGWCEFWLFSPVLPCFHSSSFHRLCRKTKHLFLVLHSKNEISLLQNPHP